MSAQRQTPHWLPAVIERAVQRVCAFREARADFEQEVWWALLEGRLDVSELYCRRSMRAFMRDTKFLFATERSQHVSLEQPLTRDAKSGCFADIIAAPPRSWPELLQASS